MNKTITIIGINYFPEDSAIGLYTTQMAEYLVSLGYNVSVITGVPYYPQWKIRKDYKGRNRFLQENINGVNVYRFKQYVPASPSFLKRVIHLLSFTLGSFFNIIKLKKSDLVICIVPFTSSILLGKYLKRKHKAILWTHIQDFEFDAAIESGLLSGNKKWIFNRLMKLEKFLLDSSDIVSSISGRMINKIQSKTKTLPYFLPNWVDIKSFGNQSIEKHKYLNSEKFKMLYSGNMGAKQDWDLFIRFVERIKEIEDVEIVIVGEGALKNKVVSEISKFKFVKFYNLVPYEELPQLLQSADLHFLFQKIDVVDTVMPSKLLGMMASKKPSIITGSPESEVSQIYLKNNLGYYLDGSSLDDLVRSVIQIKNNKEMSIEMGRNAFDYVKKNFSKESVLEQFSNKINNFLNT